MPEHLQEPGGCSTNRSRTRVEGGRAPEGEQSANALGIPLIRQRAQNLPRARDAQRAHLRPAKSPAQRAHPIRRPMIQARRPRQPCAPTTRRPSQPSRAPSLPTCSRRQGRPAHVTGAPHPHRRPVDAPRRPPSSSGARTRARRRRLNGAKAVRYEARREAPGSRELPGSPMGTRGTSFNEARRESPGSRTRHRMPRRRKRAQAPASISRVRRHSTGSPLRPPTERRQRRSRRGLGVYPSMFTCSIPCVPPPAGGISGAWRGRAGAKPEAPPPIGHHWFPLVAGRFGS